MRQVMCFRRRLRGDEHGSLAAARCLTGAVVVAMCAGQLAVLAHGITVVHFRCPEHGELTHLLRKGPWEGPLDLPAGERSRAKPGRAHATIGAGRTGGSLTRNVGPPGGEGVRDGVGRGARALRSGLHRRGTTLLAGPRDGD